MKLLEIMTAHTKPLLKVVEFLKDIITEANIQCTGNGKDSDLLDKTNKTEDEEETEETNNKSKEETSGMRITAIDETQTVLVNLKLEAQNFTKFVCKKKVMTLGVHLGWFYTILKTINNDESIILSVEHDDPNNLNIEIVNQDEGTNKLYKLKMLDLDNSPLKVPELQFDAKIIMSSAKFQKLCKEMDVISSFVEIQCTKDKIKFSCKGDMVSDLIVPYKNDPNIGVTILKKDKSPPVIQGIYELRRLVLFSKCSSLSNEIEIYMKNNFPLALKYTVATLGRIFLCLTPVDNNQDDNNDGMYEDEKVEYK